MNQNELIQQASDAKYTEIGEDAWHDIGADKIFEYGWQACLAAQPIRVTDLTTKLRQLPRSENMANRHAEAMLNAAAEIERYYGGMLAWKQTAETRDRQLAEAMEKRITERVEARLAQAQAQQPTVAICELANNNQPEVAEWKPTEDQLEQIRNCTKPREHKPELTMSQFVTKADYGAAMQSQAQSQQTTQEPYGWHIKGMENAGMRYFFTVDKIDADYWQGHGMTLVPVYLQSQAQQPYDHELGSVLMALENAISELKGIIYTENLKPYIAAKDKFASFLQSQAQQESLQIGEMRENGVNWYGKNPHAFPVGTKFIAIPPAPSEKYVEGQWWVKELDSLVKDGTPDQKRAVYGVVRKLMQEVNAIEKPNYRYYIREIGEGDWQEVSYSMYADSAGSPLIDYKREEVEQ